MTEKNALTTRLDDPDDLRDAGEGDDARHAAQPSRADRRHTAGGSPFASHAIAAVTRVLTPVSRVGWTNGAKAGEWLTGSSPRRPSSCARR